MLIATQTEEMYMMKRRISHDPQTLQDTLGRLYQSGETVPEGTYMSLDEGRLVRLSSGGPLPLTDGLPRYYIQVSDSPHRPLSFSWIIRHS